MNDVSFELDLIATFLTSIYLVILLFKASTPDAKSYLAEVFSLAGEKRSLLHQQVRRRIV